MVLAMTDTLHHLPGRLRLRLAALRRNPALAARLRHTLAPLPGVADVEANPLTGSLLVRYDPAAGPVRAIAAALAAQGVALPHRPPPDLAERLGKAAVALAVEALVKQSATALFCVLV